MKREDRRAILDWADSIGADGPTKEKINGILEDIDALDVLNSVNVEKALAQTRRKIRKSRNGRPFLSWMTAAAVSAAACTAVFLFLGILKPGTPEPLYTELKVNPGMTGTFVMPDSTVVTMNGGSSLTYGSGYGRKDRNVCLSGEAYFDVTRDPDVPFVVHTPSDSYVTVYGTQFNVDSYNEDKCKVTLINGSIGFRYTGKYGQSNEVMIQPGERLVYDKDSDVLLVNAVPVKTDIAWKDGKMILDGTPLSEILEILSKRYSVQFDVRDDKYLDYTYSGGAFTIFSLEKVLETLRYSSSFKWEYDDSVSSDRTPVITIY